MIEAIGRLIRQLTHVESDVAALKRQQIAAPFNAGKASLKTIASGVISVAKPFVVVLPESGTADDLDEIENFADGKFIVISTADVGDTITVRDESISGGNIALRGVTSRVLSDPEDSLLLIYKESVSMWIQAGGAPAGGTPALHATTHQHGGTDEVATATPAANAIPKAGGAGTLAAGWIPAGGVPGAHATSHQHGGSDEVATATPGADDIVKAAGTGKIANGWLDATLESLAALGTVADRIAYTTGVDAWAETPLTAFVRTILDDANQAAVQTTLALVPGTNVQVQDAELQAIAGLVSAADRLPYFTGLGTASLATFTAFARTILDDADQAAVRATLALTPGTNVQAQDAELQAIAGLTSAADRLPYFTGLGTAALATFTAFARTILDDADQAAVRATLALTPGTDVQAQDAELQAIAGLVSAADRLPYFTGLGTASLATFTAFARTILDDADQAAVRATLALTPGTNVQAQDAELQAIAGLTSAADKLPYFTGLGTAALADLSAFARTLIDDANQAAMRTTLALTPGTDVQAQDAELQAIAGLVSAADRLPYFTGLGTASLATFTAFARTLIDDADATTVRGTLLLGTIATEAETNYLLAAGTRPLTGEWDIGEDMAIRAERLEARDVEGLRIEDDGGNLGVFIEDGGQVGIKTATPDSDLHVAGTFHATGAADLDSTLNVDGDLTAQTKVITPTVQAKAGGPLVLKGAGGEYGALVFEGGGFTRMQSSSKGDVLYEVLAVPGPTGEIAFQMVFTRATATTVVRGFWATIHLVGRVSTAVYAATCKFWVQGRNNQTIVWDLGPANQNMTAAATTQTTTNLTIRFAVDGASGTWTEIAFCAIADSPVSGNWTISGSHIA